MREIKYRAKRKDNNEWIEGYLFETEEVDVVHTYIGYIRQTDDDLFYGSANIFIEVDKNTVCQYIGLLDRNGREIYEGDILKWINDSWHGYYECVWIEEECCFTFNSIRYRNDYENPIDCCDDDENICMNVIGNKFDNPELLIKEE